MAGAQAQDSGMGEGRGTRMVPTGRTTNRARRRAGLSTKSLGPGARPRGFWRRNPRATEGPCCSASTCGRGAGGTRALCLETPGDRFCCWELMVLIGYSRGDRVPVVRNKTKNPILPPLPDERGEKRTFHTHSPLK